MDVFLMKYYSLDFILGVNILSNIEFFLISRIFFENFWFRQSNQSNFDYTQMSKTPKMYHVTFE